MKKLTHVLGIFPGNPIGQKINEMIDFIERIAPTAKHVNTTQLPITEPMSHFLLEFDCDCFEADKTELRLRYDRIVYKNSDDTFSQYDLLTGIEYKTVV
jgi:hypothetical protein